MNIPAKARIIDATGKLILPALFDMHAKVEIEGRSKRESVTRTGQAAVQGGVWGILVQPTTGFMFDNSAALDSFREAVGQRSAAEMIPAGCISQGMKGDQQAPYNTLAARGIHILSDAGERPGNLLMLHRAMKYVAELDMCMAIRGDVPSITANTHMHPGMTSYQLGLHGTPACAEEIGLEIIVRLAQDAGCRLHVQTVSTAEGVEIIRRAKAAGCKVTAEVALHHLLFTHESVGDYDTNYKTVPPLRDKSDTEALLAGVKDGTIDCIVSDHTPCLPFAKKQDFPTAPQGMCLLDYFLPTLYTHLVKPGRLSWSELVQACCVNPCTIAYPDVMDPEEPEGMPLLLFDPEASASVTEESLPCGTLNTPLLGQTLCGSVTLPLQ
jgi:dihydroorotase